MRPASAALNKSSQALSSSARPSATHMLQDVLPVAMLAVLPLDMHTVAFAKQSTTPTAPALSIETRMDMLLSLEKIRLVSELRLMANSLTVTGDALLQYASTVAGKHSCPTSDELWVPPDYAPLQNVLSFPPFPNEFSCYRSQKSSSPFDAFREEKLIASSSEASTNSTETRVAGYVDVYSGIGESSIVHMPTAKTIDGKSGNPDAFTKSVVKGKKDKRKQEKGDFEGFGFPSTLKKPRMADRTIGALRQNTDQPKKKAKEVALATVIATGSLASAHASPGTYLKKGVKRHPSASTTANTHDSTYPQRASMLFRI